MYYDVIVIGGGLLGCFAARNLTRYRLSAAILEQAEDVCTGISKANSSIVYPGSDHKPGSLKAELTVHGNKNFSQLCRELEVPLRNCGSLMVTTGEASRRAVEKKYKNGRENNVPGMRLLTRGEVLEVEPGIKGDIISGLYAPTTSTVNSWQLGIAAFESAVINGCTPYLNTAVESISRSGQEYVVHTNRGEFTCRYIINCAGMSADRIHELVYPPEVRIVPDCSDYIVFTSDFRPLSHVIFLELDEGGKGVTFIPTPEGNLMAASPARPLEGPPGATSADHLARLVKDTEALLGERVDDKIIRSFSAVRPNPYEVTMGNGEWVTSSKSIHSFAICRPADNFMSLIGIKTPGLTCCDNLGAYLADNAAEYLNAPVNTSYDPHRKAIARVHDLPLPEREALAKSDPDYGEVVCMCQDVTCGEIKEAISRGAVSVDGVKRRVGTGMGFCQGSRCADRISQLLEGAK